MDDDDLFSVFADKGADAAKRKQPEGAASGVASVATAGGAARHTRGTRTHTRLRQGAAHNHALWWQPTRHAVAYGLSPNLRHMMAEMRLNEAERMF